VCDKIGEAYSEMIFRHGYVHCDPHPGNILVRKDQESGVEIVLLDHGLYAVCEFLCPLTYHKFLHLQDLSEQFRVDYANLWLAIINADLKGMCVGILCKSIQL
jgi:aarF domain-containing kinase